MKYTKIIIMIVSLLIGTIETLFAQSPTSALTPSFPIITPQTPEVTKLMGMINYPVSYNTGTVKTEIPIYEIKLKSGYTLPIKLVYQSSGFKPGERSNVGTGWTLVAEPQIAHAVNGLPDEDVNGLYINKGLNVTWSDPEYAYVDMAYGWYDIEPDQYFYMLPHKGGSFFLNRHPSNNNKKEFVTVPYDPIKIEGLSNLKNFRITDIDGVGYDFIPIEQTTTIDPSAGKRTNAISVYKASRIVTPNKETIQFEYSGLSKDHPYQYTISNYEQSATLDIKSMSSKHAMPYCGEAENVMTDESAAYTGNSYDHKVKLIVRNIDGQEAKVTNYHVFNSNGFDNNDLFEMCSNRSDNSWRQDIKTEYLSRISFSLGSIEFVYTNLSPYLTTEKTLTGIVIKDNKGCIVKQFHLVSELIGTKRTSLKEVQILSEDGLSYKKYNLKYWSTIGANHDTPEVNPWGYSTYQPTAMKQMCIPKLRTKFALFANNGAVVDSMYFCYGEKDYYRDVTLYNPDLNFMLKSITYPTGGRSEFTYEHSKFFESTRRKEVTTGSVRIKGIKNFQSDGALSSQRLFKYGQNESGLGIPVRVLKDTDFMTSYQQEAQKLIKGWGRYWDFLCQMYKVDLHARPVVNDVLDASASIVYDQVTEYADQQGKAGKTVYEYDYSNLADVQSPRVIEPYPLHPIMHKESLKKYREWSIGQLSSQSIYDGNGTLLQKEENTYVERSGDQISRMIIYPYLTYLFSDPYIRNWETNRALKAGKYANPIDGMPFPMGIPERYQFDGRLSFNSGCKLLSSKIVTEYKEGKQYSDTTKYSYNKYLLPILTERTLNNGQRSKESNFYPTDFDDSVSIKMINMNLFTPMIRQITTNGNAIYDVYNPYRFSSNVPVIDRIETGKGGNEREVRIRFIKYDNYGNLLEAVKDNNQLVAYIYGYGSSYPVVKLEGAGYDYLTEEMGQLQNYSDSTTLIKKCDNLRNILKGDGLVTSYTYRPLIGITSIVKPNGNMTSYAYNGFGDLINEMNREGITEKQYEYNYKYNGNQSKLSLSFSAQETYYLGANSFTATVKGGYGGYRYQWFLTNDMDVNYQSQLSDSPTFNCNLNTTGTYRLTCRVEDAYGYSSSSTVSFEVKLNLKIKFEHINYSTNSNENYMEADVICPVETNISFRLVYDTDISKGVTFYINNKEFKKTGNGNDLVTVKFLKGSSRVYVVASKASNWYSILMESADAGVSFEYPFILMKQ